MRTGWGIVLMVSLLGLLALESDIVRATSYQSFASGWTKTYGGSFDDVARSIIETVDGGYALARAVHYDDNARGSLARAFC